ncbi:MAG: sulfotransferase [Gammaproteobacteria bacterium]
MKRELGPDFVCIGAQKAGTTWLHHNLSLHPEIWMPPVKEIRFFDILCPNEQLLGIEIPSYPFGLRRYSDCWFRPSISDLRWRFRFYNLPRSIEWYYWLFSYATDEQKSGDITPSYSTLDERGVAFARRVLKPECRILFILRNPILRAWSGVKWRYRWQGINIQEIDIDSIRRDLKSPSSRLRSDYFRTISLWRQAFGDNFGVFLYDDLLENSEGFLSDIQRFIDVKPHVDKDTVVQRVNVDLAAKKMPDVIKAMLMDIYKSEILRLDTVIPGVAARWLG